MVPELRRICAGETLTDSVARRRDRLRLPSGTLIIAPSVVLVHGRPAPSAPAAAPVAAGIFLVLIAAAAAAGTAGSAAPG